MIIQKVCTRKQFRQFINLPYKLYRKDPNWVPPLRSEQKKLFSNKKNPTLTHCDYCMYLALKDGMPVGRVVAFIDHNYNNHWNSRIGFFGSFECVDNPSVSRMMLETCKQWLSQKKMTTMRGPINFETQNWGFIVDGYGPPPIMSPYNPAYYNDLVEAFGFQTVKNLEVFAGNAQQYELPERFVRHLNYLIKKYQLQIRNVDMSQFNQEVFIIIKLANASLANNWGFAPITNAEAKAIARDLKQIINPNLVFIVESKGRPIGFSITLPDVNVILRDLNGRLFPFGIIKLIFGLRNIKNYRHWALGIIPEFQRRGIDTLLYVQTYNVLKSQNAYLEANYILEDNYAMKDAAIKLGLQKVRTYRIYEMAI